MEDVNKNENVNMTAQYLLINIAFTSHSIYVVVLCHIFR